MRFPDSILKYSLPEIGGGMAYGKTADFHAEAIVPGDKLGSGMHDASVAAEEWEGQAPFCSGGRINGASRI